MSEYQQDGNGMPDILAVLPALRVVPVVVIKDLGTLGPLMQSLEDGGVPCAEITFRTACAAQAIDRACREFPGMRIGAGTVVEPKQAEKAIESGAGFIVSPGLSLSVARVCRDAGIPYLPGCVTPTEIIAALDAGIETVKFFPADVYGGVKALKALSGPFPQVRFVPTGGVDLSNLAEYLALPCVAAVGGSFLCKGDVAANCRKLKEIVRGE